MDACCQLTCTVHLHCGELFAPKQDGDVDAVYIPLPTTLHLEWAVKSAHAKKHILLEKPVACNVAEFNQIAASCRASGVVLMDGVMVMNG
jgi:predicted dehydrogenase